MTTYRISEAARATGIPVSTLRYYERIGLLPEPARTDAGYRIYEERALQRLTFIARAKALGLRLDDIADLADLWDAERCGPVQARLREMIAARIEDTEGEMASLRGLSHELATFAKGLDVKVSDAPCGPDCGCMASAAPDVPAGRELPLIARGAAAIACTLDEVGAEERLAEWRAAVGAASGRERTDDGLRLTFAADLDVAALADLAARERACCSFLSFSLAIDQRGVTLDIRAPADATEVIDLLLGVMPSGIRA